MKNQGNMIPSKNHNNLLVTDPKDMEIYNLNNLKLRFEEIQWVTKKTLKENSMKLGKQCINKMSSTEIKIINNNQAEILELKEYSE